MQTPIPHVNFYWCLPVFLTQWGETIPTLIEYRGLTNYSRTLLYTSEQQIYFLKFCFLHALANKMLHQKMLQPNLLQYDVPCHDCV